MRKPVHSDDHNRCVVITEVKRSRSFDDMEADCEWSICQIQENNCACCKKVRYLCYGIASRFLR